MERIKETKTRCGIKYCLKIRDIECATVSGCQVLIKYVNINFIFRREQKLRGIRFYSILSHTDKLFYYHFSCNMIGFPINSLLKIERYCLLFPGQKKINRDGE